MHEVIVICTARNDLSFVFQVSAAGKSARAVSIQYERGRNRMVLQPVWLSVRTPCRHGCEQAYHPGHLSGILRWNPSGRVRQILPGSVTPPEDVEEIGACAA